MSVKRIGAVLLAACMMLTAPLAHAQTQYSTDWLANTFGTLAAHVGNGARSLWVAPEGVIYTSSRWDENAGGVAIYQNGQTLGTIGIHDEFQGGAITGNANSLFVALGYNRTFGSGSVGRYNRSTNQRDLRIPVSTWTGIQYADVITGLATAGNLLYASDFYGNRVRVYTTDGVWQRDIAVSGPGALALDAAGNCGSRARARAWSRSSARAAPRWARSRWRPARGRLRFISMRRAGSCWWATKART
jgi:hypothetical protein